MKAILEFNLDEEKDEFDTMMKARDYNLALWDIQNLLRVFESKFECIDSSSSVQLFEEFRTAFWEAINDRNIEL